MVPLPLLGCEVTQIPLPGRPELNDEIEVARSPRVGVVLVRPLRIDCERVDIGVLNES